MALLANTFILLLFIKAAVLVFVDQLYYVCLNCITENIQVSEGHKYFPLKPHVDQCCSKACSTNIISHFKTLN